MVLICSTPMYALKSVCLDWLLLLTPLFLGLPCSCSMVITMHSILIYATSLTALVFDHAFLTRLALRSALCDDAFIHIRFSYKPGGMFRLHSNQYSYCELALQPAANMPCISTLYFVSGTLVRHNHASDCFLVWPPVLVLHFLPLCIIFTMFCFPRWASPTEGVFLFVSLPLLWRTPAPFLPLPLQLLCPSRQSRFLICAATALVYFLVAVVARGTLGWTGRLASVCRCPGMGLHVSSTMIINITSDGSTRFRALADIRLSFLQLREQPQAPPLLLRSYTRYRHVVFLTYVARHGRHICEQCQSSFTRFGPVLSA